MTPMADLLRIAQRPIGDRTREEWDAVLALARSPSLADRLRQCTQYMTSGTGESFSYVPTFLMDELLTHLDNLAFGGREGPTLPASWRDPLDAALKKTFGEAATGEIERLTNPSNGFVDVFYNVHTTLDVEVANKAFNAFVALCLDVPCIASGDIHLSLTFV